MKKGTTLPDEKMRARYRKIRINGVQMPLHRFIAQEAIGRPLQSNEAVHHINGNRLDNRPENLLVMSISEHSRLENVGKKLSDEHKAKVSKSLIGNQRHKGIPHTKETKLLISSSLIGNKRSKGHTPNNKGKFLGCDGHYHSLKDLLKDLID